MRRKDRAMNEQETLAFLKECKVCRVAMHTQDEVYLVPLNFGYHRENDQLTLFFHSATAGKKLEILKENGRVCFEMDGGHQLIEAEVSCRYGYSFSSIIGHGEASFIMDVNEKINALQEIMKQQTGKSFAFKESEAETVCVFKVIVTSIAGKKR